jgi:phage tail-like protein
MGDKRSYSAGHFMLSLDGEPAVLKDCDGGNVKAEIVTINMGPDNHAMKHISTLKFEPFTINIGMSMGKGLYEWIKASLDKQHMRKNGYVAAADFNYKAQSYRHFRDALISEVTVPALDASSKDTAFFTIKFDAEEVTFAAGDDAAVQGTVNTKQKKWLQSNFKLRLGDLPCTRVSKIDSFTIKQSVVADETGEARIPTKEPGKLEIPNLKITLSASDVKPWAEWFDTFVIKGENGQEAELSGAIEFMDPSLKETLGSVDLFQVGIFSLTEEKAEANKDAIKRWVAEVYVERMAFNLAYV